MSQPDAQPTIEPPARPARFVLRRLVAVVVTGALFVAGVLAPIDWIRSLTALFLFVAAPGALAATIIYGRGYVRAFAIGGMFHYWVFWIGYAADIWGKLPGISLPDDDQLKSAMLTGAGTAFVLVGGLVAMGVRWLVAGADRRAVGCVKRTTAQPSGGAFHSPYADGHAIGRIDGPADGPVPEHHPFQFTLRTMFIVTTLVAVACSGLFAPVWHVVVATIVSLIVLICVALTIAIVHARGYLRTFCVGAIFPAAMVLAVMFLACILNSTVILGLLMPSTTNVDVTFDATDSSVREGTAIGVAYYLGFCFAGGLVAIGTRWMIESPRRPPRQHVHWDPLKVVRESAMNDGTKELEDSAVETAGST
jgi:hypothetical protein